MPFFVLPFGTEVKLTKGDRVIRSKLREQMTFDEKLSEEKGKTSFKNGEWVITAKSTDVEEY